MTEEVGDELVVYVAATQTAHALSKEAAAVWRHCDGEQSAADIARGAGLDQERVAQALEQLSTAGLIEEPEGISRRALYKRTAKLGAAALSAPLIYSVAVAPAGAAASPPLCTSDCATGSVIPCASCGAAPGRANAPIDICPSRVCYQGASNRTCYCAPNPCIIGSGDCSGQLPCCAPPQFCVSGVCQQ